MSEELSALLNPLTYVIINLAIVAILRVGGVRVNEGAITQGQLIALYNYMSQILVELIKFANLILNITKSAACAGRISQVLDTKSSMVSGADALPDGAGEAELEFRHVSFRYPQAGADALTDISFCAAPGETIGVIGGTGSGKSTLANLIPRFYDATAGLRARARRGCQDASPAGASDAHRHRAAEGAALLRHHPGKSALGQCGCVRRGALGRAARGAGRRRRAG